MPGTSWSTSRSAATNVSTREIEVLRSLGLTTDPQWEIEGADIYAWMEVHHEAAKR